MEAKNAAHLRGSGGALDRVDVLFRDLIDRRIDCAHGETLGSEGVEIIERGVEVKPPFHVAEHESNHNGQIKFLSKRLPGAKSSSE